jgi:predicted DCC family thiol-disulfide oxidoreductase YuxK
MSVWPVRLLLWQLIVVYLSSTWWKLLGTMWLSGTAVATVLHHPIYARWPQWMMHLLSPLGPAMTYATIVWEAAWGLLLIPRATVIRVAPSLERFSLKRALLALGILFHGSIFLLLDVGSFFGAMLCAYAGLLTDDDIVAMRRWFASSRGNQKIAVLFDGHCGLCRRSVFVIALCDWLKRVQLVDFWDDGARKSVAPDLTIEELDKALHIRLPGGKTLKGFDALRGLVWHLPALWVTIPLLYLPGAAVVGQWGYANVAERRKKCTHQGCRISPF